MSPAFKDAPAVLARYGVPPGADAETQLAALAALGWEARVEELPAGRAGRSGASPRFRVLAFRLRPAGMDQGRRGAHEHRQASGRTAAAALGRVLAAVLEHGGEGTGQARTARSWHRTATSDTPNRAGRTLQGP